MSIAQESREVFIVGATGLIGASAYAALLQSGYHPIVLSRNVDKAKGVFGESVNALYWNGNDVGDLVQKINGSKAVINLAGESIASRWTSKKKAAIFRSRVGTTNAIVDAIRQCSAPPEVYIHGSATGYYPFNSNLSFDENGIKGGGFLSHVVHQWEQAASKVGDKSRLVIVRTGVVLSRKEGFLGKISLPIKVFAGGWFGSGNQVISWIHINDHVRAIIFLLENNACNGIYNFTSEGPTSIKTIVKRLGYIFKRPVWFSIPSFALRMMFGQMANEVILSSQIIVPKRLVEAGFKYDFSNIDDALNDLFDESIQ